MFFSCKSIVLVFAAAFVGQAAAAPHAMPMPFRKLQREVGVRADAATTNTFPENQPAMAPTGGDVEAYHNKRVVKRIQPAPEDINWIRSDIPTSAVDGFIRELPYDKRQSTTNTFPENQPAMAPKGGDAIAYSNAPAAA
ncbi:uncharacterized protein B0H18DRAFT_968770 [Fomitopsis serialis]|uniref:uncharacterized protein n=1 Tax=Fomitopsis serialis TaxID=139415 RepID=UPI0020072692|nr:uncharacterized protein B0H18DRAFT_968770 [Neoantrodia serialis]KAH9937013.1 hypothetical protein B0H18DRAFT_968770 [Neoantrodia serialis]